MTTEPAPFTVDPGPQHLAVTAWATVWAVQLDGRGLFIAGPDPDRNLRQAFAAAELAAHIAGMTTVPVLIAAADGPWTYADTAGQHPGQMLILDRLDQLPAQHTSSTVNLIDQRYDNRRPIIITSTSTPAQVGFQHGDRLALAVFSTCEVADLTADTPS